MPAAWTDSTERQLLLVMIHLTSAPRPKWDEVAALMGEGFTAESVRQRFQKLLKTSKAEFGEPGTPKGSPSKTLPKPSPRTKGKPAAGTNGTAKRKAAGAGFDDEVEGSHLKKQEVKEEFLEGMFE